MEWDGASSARRPRAAWLGGAAEAGPYPIVAALGTACCGDSEFAAVAPLWARWPSALLSPDLRPMLMNFAPSESESWWCRQLRQRHQLFLA
jgi:hypothetical protein